MFDFTHHHDDLLLRVTGLLRTAEQYSATLAAG